MKKIQKKEKISNLTKIIRAGKFFSELTGKDLEMINDECSLIKKDNIILEDLVKKYNKKIDPQLLNFISNKVFGIEYIDLESLGFVNEAIFKMLSLDFLKYKKIVPINIKDNTIDIVSNDPNNGLLTELIKAKTQKEVKFFYSPKIYIENFLNKLEDRSSGISKESTKSLFNIIFQEIEKIKNLRDESIPDDSIISLFDKLLRYSIESRASDIHIEPEEMMSIIRFRIDGILHKSFELPLYAHKLLTMRVKVLSRLRTDEHLRPMDGKFRFKFKDEILDVRVSTMPLYYGEKIVLRILKEEVYGLTLSKIGLNKANLAILERNITKSYGMILSTGPTGSGKTTSLYGIIKRLNKEEVNIMTIEDPIEYTIPLLNQIEVNEQIGLTFATGLRSILRQDPNIIMVGEIRDKDTSFISINASLTGHLVLSTLHTNNAASCFVRLLDFGIEPFLIASSVNLVVGQRLVRKICDSCKQEFFFKSFLKKYKYVTGFSHRILLALKTQRVKSLYRGIGCKNCSFTGYYGRTGIFELLETNDVMRALIMRRANSEEIQKLAISKNKMTTMFDDAIDKIIKGVTTFEELTRITLE